tara:strand:- start:9871 stop:10713 length:843 start_codon:yes stop_codon:yes gene_type:complete
MDHYEECMCLKETRYGPNDPTEKNYEYVEICVLHPLEHNSKHLCVLPKGHTGKCSHQLNFLFNVDEECKQICRKIYSAIYSTPGHDDYVYKDRTSRLFKNVLSTEEQLKIRDKTIKKKCAIPLKEYSTPFDLACAYLDWITYILNVEEIQNDYISLEYYKSSVYKNYISKHKEFMENFYKSYNRAIFNKDGFTICCVTQYLFKLEDIADKTRNMRVDIRRTDMQLGHVVPKNEETITIKGLNLVPMTREGNRLVGEHIFTENVWLQRLMDITALFHINPI